MGLADRPTQYRASVAAVLQFAWDAEDFRADHVMAALDLTRSTTLSALDRLIDLGLVRELSPSGPDDTTGRLGRPARRFELRDDAGVVVGLDAGGHRFTAVVADLAGRRLAVEHVDLVPGAGSTDEENRDVAQRREAALRAIDGALAAAGVGRDAIIAVGAGVPAPVNADGVSPPHPDGFWPVMNAELRATLAGLVPAVRIENDAALAALAESDLGEARARDHFVALLAGRRLGSGVVLDGRLVRGAHGGIGELEALAHVAEVGGAWGLGDLAERWVVSSRAAGRIPADHPWARLSGTGLTAEALLGEPRPHDPVAHSLVRHLGRTLGRVCVMLARFYDPEVIVVCGAMVGALGEVIEIARAQVADELELPAPAIVASRLGGDVVSLGAVCAAREAARHIILPLFAERRRAGR